MSDIKPLRIVYLYPREMNIYGDHGNVQTILRRIEWHGLKSELVEHHPGKAFPEDVDLVIGGGGQDSGQGLVKDDLLKISDDIHTLADAEVPMLMICGMYQLFGRFFKTAEGVTIPGIDIFKAETHGGPTRLVGNVVTEGPFGELIGYENHSGLTILDDEQPALGRVIKGAGNNGEDKTEGAIYKCVFGSYLHGSLLPKNPVLADALIEAAAIHRYGGFEPRIFDDTFATKAREVAKKTPALISRRSANTTTMPTVPPKTSPSTSRIHELDLLRGFFVLCIILDHGQRLPSLHTYFTGDGKLWVSAAEGFFLISGLLIGYVRGYKQREVPLKKLSTKLIKRGLMLYISTVILTFLLVALTGSLPLDPATVAKLPLSEQVATLPTYVWNVVSTNYGYDWIYFLRLYAIMLIVSPLFIWLLRRGKIAVAMSLSLSIYALSFLQTVPEGGAQWQVLFFTAAVVGYKIPVILRYFKRHPRVATLLKYGSIVASLLIFWASYFWVLAWPDGIIMSRQQYVDTRVWLDPLFSNNPLMPLRIILSMIWFSGILSLFHIFRRPILRYFDWLLMTFGQYSLSVYCLQAIVLVFAAWLIPFHMSYIYNFFVDILLVLSVWLLMQIPLVRRVLPK